MATERLSRRMYDELAVSVYADNETMGRAAAEAAEAIITEAIRERGLANVIVATGNSQLTFLRALREKGSIDWPAVNVFHMDEYLGLAPGHAAGFAAYLHLHLIDHVAVERFYPVPRNPEDVGLACEAYEALLRAHPADLCCLGIGENGHLAFNEPAVADFDDEQWVEVIELEEASRRQQVGEGHYQGLDEVPTQAITLTIPALRSAKRMLCIVPEERKAEAVRAALMGPVTTACPASILRQTSWAELFLDQAAASLLKG